MKELFGLAAIGGLMYWAWQASSTAPQIVATERQYPKAIGPGLTGATNVSKVRIEENGFLSAPMGTYAKR